MESVKNTRWRVKSRSNFPMMILSAVAMLSLQTGCSTYTYAKNIKMMSFDNDVQTGRAIGPTRGADCTWSIMGVQLGSEPTLDRALGNARTRSGEGAMDAVTKGDEANAVRYMANVSTDWDGFNAAGIIAKKCIVVKGIGYR